MNGFICFFCIFSKAVQHDGHFSDVRTVSKVQFCLQDHVHQVVEAANKHVQTLVEADVESEVKDVQLLAVSPAFHRGPFALCQLLSKKVQ